MNRLKRLSSSSLLQGISWIFLSTTVATLLRSLLVFIIIRFYTQEQFGLWGSITSIAAVIITGDFGLTNVLRSIASKNLSRGKEGDEDTKRYFYSTLIFFSTLALLLALILIFFHHYVPFEKLFKTEDLQLQQQGHIICTIVLLLFFFTIPLSIPGALFFSYGENKYNAIFGFISSVFTFIIVSGLAIFKVSIVYTSVIYFICPLLVYIISTCFFIYKRKWWNIRIQMGQTIKDIKFLLPLGIKYLIIGFAGSFLTNILTIYSGALLGLKEAAIVNIAQKVFTFFTSIYQSVLNPIWSKLATLYFQKNFSKCKRLWDISLLMTLLAAFGFITISTTLSDIIVRFIAGENFISSPILFCMVGCSLFLKIIFDNVSLLQVAINQIDDITIGYIIFTIISMGVFPHIVYLWSFRSMVICMIALWCIFSLTIYYRTNHIQLRPHE